MMLLYRLGSFLFSKGIPFLPKLFEGLIFLIFNSRIPSDVKIGKGTKFAYHGMSILLVHETAFGEDCLIGVRVTTGRNFPYMKVPVIGNRVWIGPNSVIIGPVIIEDDVIIASNSLVNKSIPAGAIVAGNPAKIIGWSKDLEYNIFENPKQKDGIAPFMEIH